MGLIAEARRQASAITISSVYNPNYAANRELDWFHPRRKLVFVYRMETFGGVPLSDSEFSAWSNIRLKKGQRWSWKLVVTAPYFLCC